MPEPACETALRQLSDLIAGDLDGGDAAALDRHLAACDACYRQSVKLLRQDRAFTQMATRARLEEATSRLRRELRPPRRWAIFALVGSVAAAVLLVASYFLFSTPTMVLEDVAGDVRIDDSVAGSGDGLRPGQSVETKGSGQATIRFADSTTVELSEKTLVRDVQDSGGKRLIVAWGAVAAKVAKQPEGRPMILTTATSEVRVLGTTLRMVVDTDQKQTRLEVIEGLVRLTRLADRKTVDVPSGHFAVAAPGIEPTLRPLARGKAPRDLLQLDYKTLRAELNLKSKAWAALPWAPTLTDARETAAREKKPILMFVGPEHPLGWTGANALSVREGVLNDPEVAKFVAEKFVPLAISNGYAQNMTPAERAWVDEFASGIASYGGLSAFTPEGKKIGTGSWYEPRAARAVFERWHRAFRPSAEPLPAIDRTGVDSVGQPPSGGLILLVTWKAFYDEPFDGPDPWGKPHSLRFKDALGSDRLWVRRDEAEALAEGKLPETLKARMIRYHLDGILSTKLKRLDLTLEEGRIRGSAHREDSPSEDITLEGFVEQKEGKLVRFELLVRGAGLRAEGNVFLANLSVAPKGRRIPTAILFELAAPEGLSRVAPRHSRDASYLR